ncbi:hypothetical protein PHLCEN_2v495 [Hermanssonia centrifuga]|uniref:rRNA biogenesis protein RRP36 n=1 Tax=Hermanssonia centrifuga TaxID=98765 RepID=A0A2R6S5V0_9APHY|nr:hypothetical protein PHLCEN_2v495 [Hermanssonia centrifuga]
MPRRPRPNSRQKSRNTAISRIPEKLKAATQPPNLVKRSRETSTSNHSGDIEPEDRSENEESDADDDSSSDPEEDDVDADAPRVVQWVDDEELNGDSEGDESESDQTDDEEDTRPGPSNLKSLQNDLSSISLGALRQAQKALARGKARDDSDSDSEKGDEEDGYSEGEEESGPEETPTSIDHKGKEKERERKDIATRKNKHAPQEVTSKRPVSRKRPAIEEKKLVPRDPRFLHITGEFSADKFRSQYGFLSDMHEEEMKTLKDNLKRARKMLASSPAHLREEREFEVQRLERALKRAESTVNRDKRERVEQSALSKVRQEEREKQKQGKGAWYMKDADKKELFVRAKFDALASSGGRTAVKRAIEKKQLKVNQKEKKRRPFAPGQGAKRPSSSQDGPRQSKRQRVG